MNQAAGIALIQVLLITALLSVFALFLNQGASRHIHLSMLAQQRAEAEILLHSAKNELLYTLLTEPLLYPAIGSSESISQTASRAIQDKWNFHNQEFPLSENVKIKIQDQSALLNVNFFPSARLVKLLTSSGASPKRAKQITDTLLDWLDADNIPRELGNDSFMSSNIRNGKIVDITEIEKALVLTEDEKKVLYSNLSVFSRGDLNIMSASKELIASMSTPEKAEFVTQLREQGKLNIGDFKEYTGIEYQDGIRFASSNRLGVQLLINYKNISLSKNFVLKISPYAKNKTPPYDLLLERN